MPRFKIHEPGTFEAISDIIANDPGSVLNAMCRLGCRDADIFKDDVYSFSARLDANEVWSIFDRHGRGDRRHTVPAASLRAE